LKLFVAYAEFGIQGHATKYVVPNHSNPTRIYVPSLLEVLLLGDGLVYTNTNIHHGKEHKRIEWTIRFSWCSTWGKEKQLLPFM
jgi:hypothetical protein